MTFKRVIRLFLATPKGMVKETSNAFKATVLAVAQAEIPAAIIDITTADEEFARSFSQYGGWRIWPSEMGRGLNPITREPLFHAFILPAPYFGTGTAQILKAALAVQKPVFWLDCGSAETPMPPRLNRRMSIVCVDTRDKKTGWIAQ
ncbi:MAG: hypothetical protein Q7R39_11100 [Dehalococcoidia bacterium]|nr:hypothetical protein [Dehalococcoidia bacterium]